MREISVDFPALGKADEADVRQQFQFQAQLAFFTGLAVLVFARRLVPRANEMRIAIAAPAVPALGREISLAGLGQVEKLLVGIQSRKLRCRREL